MNPDPEILRRLLDFLFDSASGRLPPLSERDLERSGPGEGEASLLDAAFGESSGEGPA